MEKTYFVYFWKYADSAFIKIGNSSNTGFHNRISQAKTCDVRDVIPLGIIYASTQRDAVNLEKELHNTFDRVRPDREWFHETSELLRYINENAINATNVIEKGIAWKRERNAAGMKKYRKENPNLVTSEQKERRRERESTPEFRERDSARRRTPEYLAKKKVYMDNYQPKQQSSFQGKLFE